MCALSHHVKFIFMMKKSKGKMTWVVEPPSSSDHPLFNLSNKKDALRMRVLDDYVWSQDNSIVNWVNTRDYQNRAVTENGDGIRVILPTKPGDFGDPQSGARRV